MEAVRLWPCCILVPNQNELYQNILKYYSSDLQAGVEMEAARAVLHLNTKTKPTLPDYTETLQVAATYRQALSWRMHALT